MNHAPLHTHPGAFVPAQAVLAPARQSSGLWAALAPLSLVCAVLTGLSWFVLPMMVAVLAPAALVLGILGLVGAKKGHNGQRAMAIVGMIGGVLAAVVPVALFILFIMTLGTIG